MSKKLTEQDLQITTEKPEIILWKKVKLETEHTISNLKDSLTINEEILKMSDMKLKDLA